ncbi:MAG: tetratricopeptide repeat protein [Chitinophagaceae bacterium]|nr:MAG: tetratricopeptide repeat protein [Chitinophagaceae bacterium]
MDRIARIKELLLAQPDDSFLLHALALEYIKMDDDAAARGLFERLLGRDPGYVGSYYHLAKLLERQGEEEAAIAVYEEGMRRAKAAGDNHAFSELRSAYEELTM